VGRAAQAARVGLALTLNCVARTSGATADSSRGGSPALTLGRSTCPRCGVPTANEFTRCLEADRAAVAMYLQTCALNRSYFGAP